MAYNLNPESLPAVRCKPNPPPPPGRLGQPGRASRRLRRPGRHRRCRTLSRPARRQPRRLASARSAGPASRARRRGRRGRALSRTKSAPAVRARCGCGLKSPPRPHSLRPRLPPKWSPRSARRDCRFRLRKRCRAALAHGKKIFIGPRTIVTPSARELAAPGEILVRAQR